MKVSSKAMSSPGRSEKFPPPVMRFLRSNAGSKSRRSRSRSSPMFARKKSSTAIETQEPSSPKVTCIGQVRMRRSNQGSGKAAKAVARKNTRGWCKWIRNALCCNNHFVARLKPKPTSFPPVLRQWWVSCLRRKSVIVEETEAEDSSRIESSKLEDGYKEESEESQDDVGNEEARVLYSSSFSPPKNALLLTRCRSAPYRSSSLANRFWGSPPPLSTVEEPKTGPERADPHNHPASENELRSRDSAAESRTGPETDGDSEYLKSEDFSACERSTIPTTTEAFETEPKSTTPALLLTRCKSEPARTGARLYSDTTGLLPRKTSPTVQAILPNKFLQRL